MKEKEKVQPQAITHIMKMDLLLKSYYLLLLNH